MGGEGKSLETRLSSTTPRPSPQNTVGLVPLIKNPESTTCNPESRTQDCLTWGEMKCMQCVINGRNGGRVFIYVRGTRANRTPNNLERLESVTTKFTNRRSKPFLVYLEQITSIFSVILWALLYSKDTKHFELIFLTWITLRWCYTRRFATTIFRATVLEVILEYFCNKS